MTEDDFDSDAFIRIEKFLKNNFPATTIYEKQFIGRHDDSRQGVDGWIIRQYKQVLKNQFNR
jgi:hypothetical protein